MNEELKDKIFMGYIVFCFILFFVALITFPIVLLISNANNDAYCNSNYALDNSTENKAYAVTDKGGRIIKCCADVIPEKYKRSGLNEMFLGEQGIYYKTICVDVQEGVK